MTERRPVNGRVRAFVLGGGLLFVLSLVYGVVSYATDFGAPGSSPVAQRGGAIVVDVALFTLFALHHSLFARSGLKRRVAARASPELERSVYVWVASALFIALCVWWRPVPGTLWLVSAPWSQGLIVIQIAGLIVTGVASRQLDVLSLAGIRQVMAGPRDAPVALIRRGLYAIVRHPIYFGWVLMVWPTPHMTGTRLVFAIVSTAYLALAIPFEERSLSREFSDYPAYAAAVRWRMIPFIY